jgi:iron(III) transport system substrate-binding protein
VLNAFTQKFGVRVQTDGGSGSARATRVLAELKAGKHALDIGSFSAASTTRRLGPAGALAEIPPLLIHPDVLDTSKWYSNRHWYLDTGNTKTVFNYTVRANNVWVFWYNTQKLTKEDVASLKTPWDFLDPKWKGAMADQSWGDPGRMGGMLEAYFAPDAGPDWVRKYLTEMNVAFTSDPRLEETWLVRGRNPLKWDEGDINDALRSLHGVMPIAEVMLPRQQGVLDARSSECCMVVFKDAPNPNAAKLFLNWFLTKEGQTYVHAIKPARRYTSLREDVAPLNTVESARREPGRNYSFRDFDSNYLSKEDEARNFILKAYQDGQAQKR